MNSDFFFLCIKITQKNFLIYVYSTATRAPLTNRTVSARYWCLTTRTFIFHNGYFSLPVCCRSTANLFLLTANTVGPSSLFDAITWGLRLIAGISANVPGFCILILTMINSSPFGKTNSLRNEVFLHTNVHCNVFMKYSNLFFLMQVQFSKLPKHPWCKPPLTFLEYSAFNLPPSFY